MTGGMRLSYHSPFRVTTISFNKSSTMQQLLNELQKESPEINIKDYFIKIVDIRNPHIKQPLYNYDYNGPFNIGEDFMVILIKNWNYWTAENWNEVMHILNLNKFTKIEWFKYLLIKPSNLTLEKWYLKLNACENDIEIDKILKENADAKLYPEKNINYTTYFLRDELISTSIKNLLYCKPNAISINKWFDKIMIFIKNLYGSKGIALLNYTWHMNLEQMEYYENLFKDIYIDESEVSKLSKWTTDEWNEVIRMLILEKFSERRNKDTFSNLKWIRFLSMKPNNITLKDWYLKLNTSANDAEIDDILEQNKNTRLYLNDFYIIPDEIIKIFDNRPNNIPIDKWFEEMTNITTNIMKKYANISKNGIKHYNLYINCMMPKFIDIELLTKISTPYDEYLASLTKIFDVQIFNTQKNLKQIIEMATAQYEIFSKIYIYHFLKKLYIMISYII